MRGAIERRGKAWRIRVDIDRDPVSGRRRQLTRTVNGTKRQAEETLARLLVEMGDGRHQGTGVITVGDLCSQWFEQARRNMEPNTATEFAGVIRRYTPPRTDVAAEHDVLRRGIASIPLRKLRAWDLDRLYAQLLAGGGRDGRPLASNTVRKLHTVLRLAFDQAVRWQWLTVNPAVHASPPSTPRNTPKPPGAEEARLLIQTAEAEDPEWATFLRTAAALGARRGEICALRWSAVDLVAGSVAVDRAIVKSGALFVERDYPKTTSSRRRVSLDAGTMAMLADHRRRQSERAAACGCVVPAHAYVFSTEVDGSQPANPTVATHRFKRLARRVGLDHLRLHDLRHYVATQLISGGVDVRTVAGRLGHANPSVTLSTYAAWVPARDHEAAQMLGALLDPPAATPLDPVAHGSDPHQ